MPAPEAFAERARTANADAWQTEGRLRTAFGGGAIELPGVRLMASGLYHARWNSGDVTEPSRVDIEAVRAWYLARVASWGLRVPEGARWRKGRFVARKRLMGLEAAAFRPAAVPEGVAIRPATPGDLDAVARIDAAAFGDRPDDTRRWVAPRLGAAGVTVALAALADEPVGVATCVRTDDRAGPCAGIFAVGVLPAARRRGVASALTSWLLERALDSGVTLAHLNPDTEDAARVYARLGFAETPGFDIYVDM